MLKMERPANSLPRKHEQLQMETRRLQYSRSLPVSFKP